MKNLSLLMLAALLAAAPFAQGQVCFTPEPLQTHSLGRNHYDIKSADMTGDGEIDLITTEDGINKVSIMKRAGTLGNGQPQFTTTSVTVGTEPTRLFVGDLNNDGSKDIAVTNKGDGTVTVLLNDGSGGMTSASYTVGNNPLGIIGGHFNASTDGFLDLAVVNYVGNTLRVLYGSASGVFTLGSPISTSPYSPCDVTAGDFDGDGLIDLAVAQIQDWDGFVKLYKGNGIGGFAPSLQIGGLGINASWQRATLDTADFNLDGKTDIAVVFPSGNSPKMFIVKNNSLAGIPNLGIAEIPLNTTQTMFDLVTDDFNGDKVPDIGTVLRGFGGVDSIRIMLGKSDFSFLPKSFGGDYNFVQCLTAADFNHDGKPDIATGNYIVSNPNAFDIYTMLNTTPYFSITGSVKLCGIAPQTTTITATSPTSLTYTWNTLSGSGNGATFDLVANAANTYFSVSGNNGLGCYNTSFGRVVLTTVNTAVTATNGTLTADAQNSTFQWFGCASPNDTLLQGYTLQAFTPTFTGAYAVQVTTNGCVDTSACQTVVVDLAIAEASSESGFKIYPNPNDGQFNVDLSGLEKKYNSIAILDIYGRRVQSINLAGEKKNISLSLSLTAGIYFLRLEGADSKSSERIIIY